MSYTLETLVTDIRRTLKNTPNNAGSSDICRFVEKALGDETFISTHFGPDKVNPRHIIHEDAEFGFCVCVHISQNAKNGQPHDHGPSWAVYGQAEGVTEMTHWRIVEAGNGDKAAMVEQVDTLVMEPGMAHFYAVGDVHAPNRSGKSMLLRIEGANLDHIKRSHIKPLDGLVA
jgi:hypothetical protein